MGNQLSVLIKKSIRTWVSVQVVCCIIWVNGCSGEDPVTPVEVSPAIRTSPQNAWQGLQWSLDQHKTSGWVEAIGVSFVYLPDSTSADRYPNAFESWDREVELNFVKELFSADLVFDAQMLPEDFEQPQPTSSSVSWEAVEYSVQVEGAGGIIPVVYRGIADLEFRLEGNFWYLIRWEDLRGGTAPWNPEVVLPTLGELRAVYRTK